MSRRTPHEVEIKLPVTDLARMRRLLRRLGRIVKPRVHEQNTLLDTPRHTLRKRGSLLRLRVTRPDPGRGPALGLLTYKGPSLRHGAKAGKKASRYKVRKEIEVSIPDPNLLLQVLEAAGLGPVFQYEKYRTTFVLRGVPGAHVELDETPVGTFVEVEGPPRAIDRAARLLGYGANDYLTSSYLALHAEDCRRRGEKQMDMLFRGKRRKRSKLRK